MSPPFTPREVEERYHVYNEHNPENIAGYFSEDVTYVQLDTNNTIEGRDALIELVKAWLGAFADIQVIDLITEPADDRLAEVAGAVQCVRITLTAEGRYIQTLPGLEDRAPAHGRWVQLPMTEVLWLDEAGLALRVENKMDLTALQRQ